MKKLKKISAKVSIDSLRNTGIKSFNDNQLKTLMGGGSNYGGGGSGNGDGFGGWEDFPQI